MGFVLLPGSAFNSFVYLSAARFELDFQCHRTAGSVCIVLLSSFYKGNKNVCVAIEPSCRIFLRFTFWGDVIINKYKL